MRKSHMNHVNNNNTSCNYSVQIMKTSKLFLTATSNYGTHVLKLLKLRIWVYYFCLQFYISVNPVRTANSRFCHHNRSLERTWYNIIQLTRNTLIIDSISAPTHLPDKSYIEGHMVHWRFPGMGSFGVLK